MSESQRLNQFISRRESRSLSELTRQITPPTKNGHAPPSTSSSKSSQSDLPSQLFGSGEIPRVESN